MKKKIREIIRNKMPDIPLDAQERTVDDVVKVLSVISEITPEDYIHQMTVADIVRDYFVLPVEKELAQNRSGHDQ